ncbi:MAG: CBS domain-containing protein [Pseudomonadota bacterium]
MQIKDRPEFGNKPKPLSFPASTTVADAVSAMSRLNYGSVVVADSNGKLEGLVTERDIMKRLVNEGLDAKKTTLNEIMTSDLRTAKETDDVRDWLRAMSNERFRRVPVVDDEGHIQAIMTQGDFVSYTWPELIYQAKEMTVKTVSNNSQLALIAGGIAIYTIVLIFALAAIF